MSALSFVQTQPGTLPSVIDPTSSCLQLRLHETLASAHRLWVRGRVLGLPAPAPRAGSWWGSRGESAPARLASTATLETHVSGKDIAATVTLGARGEFDAAFDVELPPTRRGWRVARNHLTWQGQSAEQCSLVLTPPADAAGILIVLLPRAEAFAPNAGQRLGEAMAAAELTSQLQKLHQGTRGRHSVYYLAYAGTEAENLQAELALAATAVGWPSGHFVLMPCDPASADAAVTATLDRLRWLFAGALDLLVVNLDPAARALIAGLEPAPDRAGVSTLILPHDRWPKPQEDGLLVHIPACGAAPRPMRSGLVTRYPLVFCHGMLACSMLRMRLSREYNYWAVLRTFLQERGFRALYPLVSPTGGIEERGRQLKEQILRWTDEPVNLIAHSMGGLDCRQMITHLGMADRVKSLTTFSTPHRGSPVADWAQRNLRHRVPLLLALEAGGINVDGFRDCSPVRCRAFSARTPNMPQVRYFSYGGDVPLQRVTPMLRRAWDMITVEEGANDGLVSLQSARWGEYLGTLYADHFAQTPDGLFVHPGEDFDSLGFITRVVEDLARRGF